MNTHHGHLGERTCSQQKAGSLEKHNESDVVTITEGRGEHIDIEREEMYGGYSSGAGWDGRLGTELGQPCHTSE